MKIFLTVMVVVFFFCCSVKKENLPVSQEDIVEYDANVEIRVDSLNRNKVKMDSSPSLEHVQFDEESDTTWMLISDTFNRFITRENSNFYTNIVNLLGSNSRLLSYSRNSENLRSLYYSYGNRLISDFDQNSVASSEIGVLVESLLASYKILNGNDRFLSQLYDRSDTVSTHNDGLYLALLPTSLKTHILGTNGALAHDGFIPSHQKSSMSWLFSFWTRRYHEGNIEVVYEILNETNRLLKVDSLIDETLYTRRPAIVIQDFILISAGRILKDMVALENGPIVDEKFFNKQVYIYGQPWYFSQPLDGYVDDFGIVRLASKVKSERDIYCNGLYISLQPFEIGELRLIHEELMEYQLKIMSMNSGKAFYLKINYDFEYGSATLLSVDSIGKEQTFHTVSGIAYGN